MTLYVDVGQVRVQAYLSRTRRLAGRRGASELLAEATSRQAIHSLLDRSGLPARINDEAGDIDGVVSLIVDQEDQADLVVTAVMQSIASRVPAAELEAVVGRGECYLAAVAHEIGPRRDTGETTRWQAPSTATPVFRRCEECLVDPAETEVGVAGYDEPRRVCADCAARYRKGRAAVGRSTDSVLGDALDRPGRPPDFASLAALGIDQKRNHLASVFIDGNALGSFFTKLAETDHDPQTKGRVSAGITAATDQALLAAAQAATARTTPSSRTLPVAVQVKGGDDVLVSLPASLVWEFVPTFLRAWEQATSELLASEGITDRLSVSAGVAIAHQSHPIDRSVAAAEQCLRRAKASSPSSPLSTLLWVDITQEGESPPARRPVLSIADLGRLQPAIDAARALHQGRRSAHANLVALARSSGSSDAIRHQIRRLALDDSFETVLESEGSAGLVAVLDLGRWWL